MARLEAGQKAPAFSVQDTDGRLVSLDAYSGKHLLLCFYRFGGCPYCNFALHEMIENYPRLHAKGLEVVAFFQSSKESIEEQPKLQKPPFPLVSDHDKRVYDLYGVVSSKPKGIVSIVAGMKRYKDITEKRGFRQGKVTGDFFLFPADFLIGPDSTILRANYWQNFWGQSSPEEIENSMK